MDVESKREDQGPEQKAQIVQAEQPLSTKDEEAVADAASVSDSPSGLPFSKARCIALVATVTGAAFLNTLGVQASVIILPAIGRELNIPDSRQQWIISSYNLTFGCFLLLWGRLADVYGKRIIFIWGSIWMTVTSIIVPFVPNEIGFNVFRGLQGLGAAAMVPTAMGILGVTFPPGKAKNYAFSTYGAGAPLGAGFGNIFGGILAQYLNWRWVFWVYGILGTFCAVAGYFVIPLPPAQAEPVMRNTIDWVGGTIITVALVILLFALTEGNTVGWSTPWIPTLIAVSILFIAAFCFWQHHLETRTQKRPLMKMSIFKNTKFSAANVIMMLFYSSFNNYLIFATYWFQDYQGLSVVQTMLRFVPNGITGVTMAIITSQLLSRVRGDFILIFGTISVSISSMLFAIPISEHTTYWAYGFPAMVLSVSGSDTLFPVLTLFVAKTLPAEDQSLGGALIMSVGQIGRAIGLALATAIQTAIIAREKGVRIDEIGGKGQGLEPWDEALKVSIRQTAWFNLSIGIAALCVVLGFIRGVGIVGGKH